MGLPSNIPVEKHTNSPQLDALIRSMVGKGPLCKVRVSYHPNGLIATIFLHMDGTIPPRTKDIETKDLYVYKIIRAHWIGHEPKQQALEHLKEQYHSYMKRYKQHLDFLPDRKVGILPENITAEQFDNSLHALKVYITREIISPFELCAIPCLLLCSENSVLSFQDIEFIQLRDIISLETTEFPTQQMSIALSALHATN